MFEKIKIIAELWPLVAVTVFGLFIIIFKDNIANSLDRLSKLNIRDGEVDIEFHNDPNRIEKKKLTTFSLLAKISSKINYKAVLDTLSSVLLFLFMLIYGYILGIVQNEDDPWKKKISRVADEITLGRPLPREFSKTDTPPKLILELEHANLEKANEIIIKDAQEINKQDINGFSALHIAAQKGYFDTVNFLLKNGANPNLKTIHGKEPLFYAASNGYASIVNALLENGADPNARCAFGCSALINAIRDGYYDVVKLLINKRTHVDEHFEGTSALMFAVINEYSEITSLLLKKKADINFSNKKGDTALIWASAKNNVEIFKILLSANPNIDAQNNNGKTALIVASEKGQYEIASLLLDNGANIKIKDNDNMSALDYAEKNNHDKVVSILKLKK